MKKLLVAILLLPSLSLFSQTTTVTTDYKVIDIGWNGYGDYTRSLILLHEVYGGALIGKNYAIGTLRAMRGNSAALDRTDVAQINSSSAYRDINASVVSFGTFNLKWSLKTAIYNGKKYIALDVPYSDAFHDWGYQFVGWTTSTGENMKCVSYMVKGQAVNQDILSDIQDFTPNLAEFHDVTSFVVNGNIGIGTAATSKYKINVEGSIRANEIVVNTTGADFVFDSTYNLRTLPELETFIKQNKHLPEIAPAKEMQENGVSAGEMQAKLLQKIEELTLYVIELKKENVEQQKKIAELIQKVDKAENNKSKNQ
jgi:hypothetical protein